jgi:hypothetical protein
MVTDQEAPISTTHALRRRWKPTKEQLAADDAGEVIRIRIHRACSWMQRVEEIAGEASEDSMVILRWIALNSLYGRWDESAREPVNERASLRTFYDAVLEIDADDCIGAMLEEHRKLVMSIFDDEYLNKWFWEEPTDRRAAKSKKTKFNARTWYVEGRHALILDRLLDRVYFMRCQLVHGAATHGSSLNRTALRRCAMMLGHLLPAPPMR